MRRSGASWRSRSRANGGRARVAQQPLASGAVGGLDAHRAVDRNEVSVEADAGFIGVKRSGRNQRPPPHRPRGITWTAPMRSLRATLKAFSNSATSVTLSVRTVRPILVAAVSAAVRTADGFPV